MRSMPHMLSAPLGEEMPVALTCPNCGQAFDELKEAPPPADLSALVAGSLADYVDTTGPVPVVTTVTPCGCILDQQQREAAWRAITNENRPDNDA
jgi:hypothetical protein